MSNLSKYFLLTIALIVVGLCFQSCTEQGVELEKQKVQFSVVTAAYGESVNTVELPENAHARISVASSSGVVVLSDHEITVYKSGANYITDAVELASGSYTITDFAIISDSVALFVTPKRGAELSSSAADALPYNFSVAQSTIAPVSMHVTDVLNQDLQRFGYGAAKAKGNTISLAIYENKSSTRATAELRQNKKLLSSFSLNAGVNTINFGGDSKLPYTLTVFTRNSASTETFDIKQLKKDLGKNPFKINLAPALVLTIESYVDPANEYEEYFDFRMDGQGAVNINWGDGEQTAARLPLEVSHEYTTGNYTAIITGDVKKVTDFSGFSYSSIITTITGLTNLTALKVYDPSWGAVPIKVDLSKCKQLERINVAKYGAPYEPADLRTDFKLPTQHRINTFIFDAPSFDSGREFISAEELEAMVNNVYNNTLARNIYNGKFFVNPVVAPTPATQAKLDVLVNQFNWQVGFNDEIYNAYDMQAARSKNSADANGRREQWLRDRFSNSEKIIKRGLVTASLK